jgi:hypothetical protein
MAALMLLLATEAQAAVSLAVAPDRVAILNGAQQVAFVKNSTGSFAISTFIRSGNSWLPMFDSKTPILEGPQFNLLPTAYAVVENTARRAAVLFSGTHQDPQYAWTLLVEATANSPLIRFRITCRLPAMLTLAGLAPNAMLWMTEPKEQVELSQGPGNIYFGQPEKQWGNSFPAAYLWADGKEAAVFFNMTPMDWMSPRNLYRFYNCRVQTLSQDRKTGLGMHVVKRNFHEVPAGDMVFEFYLHGGPRPQKPTRMEALDTMIRAFAELHPATAPWPEDRLTHRPATWADFARGTIENLMLRDVCWADIPFPDGKPWQDGPLFSETTVPLLRVSPDYAVNSGCSPELNRKSVQRLWDFSCCNNYLAAWIACNRLHPDAAQTTFLDAKIRCLPAFYDPLAKLFRYGPGHANQWVPGKEMSWQNFTFSLEAMKIHRLRDPKDFDPAIAGKFLMNTAGLIELAHNENYVFPQWFDPRSKRALTQSDVPELGVIYEPWQAGAYAYLMCLAYEMTGEKRYLTEARTAIDRLFEGMQFTVKNARYEITYRDPVDFPITEIFGNAWGVAASQLLYQQTGDAKYLHYSANYRNVLLRMTYWYESQLRDDPRDLFLHNAGLFRNQGGSFNGSPWENVEAVLPLTLALKHSTDKFPFALKEGRGAGGHKSEPVELLLRILNLQRINGFYYYPPVFVEAVVPCKQLQDSPANYLPIEDFYMTEQGGRHGGMGRAVYMSSMAPWYYLLYEALAESGNREVMVLNLDFVDAPQDALTAAERNFLVYNPTDAPRKFMLKMKCLPVGDYQLTITGPNGHDATALYSAAELTQGTPLSLPSHQYVRARLTSTESEQMQRESRAVQTAQNRLAHAYQLLQESARDRGINDKLRSLQTTFDAAYSAYRQGNYREASTKAGGVIDTLRDSLRAD